MLDSFSARQRQLLELLLERKEGMTLEALAHELGISKSAVRQHLATLERSGYVTQKGLLRTGGRPSPLYVLTDRGNHLFPKQYAWFAEVLLDHLFEQLGAQEVERRLYRLGQQVAASLSGRLAGKRGRERLEAIVALMRELGYEARLEGEEIVAKNCVYHDLARRHREDCAFDLGLLDGLLERRALQEECMVRGGTACRFCLVKWELDRSEDHRRPEPSGPARSSPGTQSPRRSSRLK